MKSWTDRIQSRKVKEELVKAEVKVGERMKASERVRTMCEYSASLLIF